MTEDGAYYINDEPLIRYQASYQEQPKFMLTEGYGGALMGGMPSVRDKPYNYSEGTSEQLLDDIEWEPHVDRADKLDYIVAVSSGVLAGLLDSFFVGEFSLDRANEWGKARVQDIVMKVARVEGYRGNNIKEAIKTLENNHRIAADGVTNEMGGALQHHFRDFSHHFSIGGLICSILTQFTGLAYGTDTTGRFIAVPIPEKYRDLLGKNLQEKLAFGIIEWFFHMVSDMAGSSGEALIGVGIPGPLVSFMKELSALPFFKDSVRKPGAEMPWTWDDGFRMWLTKLFNGTLLAKRDEYGKILKGSDGKPMKMPFDLRTEIGVLGELGRQATPTLVNQCIVRGFYFCRRACREINDLGIKTVLDLRKIAPEDVLPYGTPAMRRMITVSAGVLVGVDLVDAAIRSRGSEDFKRILLRINYVGVATFIVACTVDISDSFAAWKAEQGESPESAYERSVSELRCLKLDFAKARILHSIEHANTAHDIINERRPKIAARKQAWLKEWDVKVADAVSLVWATDSGYFYENDDLYDAISLERHAGTETWIWLVTLETLGFTPYTPLHGGNDEHYKGLKSKDRYMTEVFCKRQTTVSSEDLKSLAKALVKARGRIDGNVGKRVIRVAGTAVASIGAAAVAFYFAPALAPMIAMALGAPVASLSGAALTSASLAFLGGGALAVGGAGMAGGTMLIAGGGALVGALSGSGVSAVTTAALASNGNYVLAECSKLLVFCEEVLLKRYGDRAAVIEIHESLSRRILELELEVEALTCDTPVAASSSDDDEDDVIDSPAELSPKKMIKVLRRSLKYLQKCSDELEADLQRSRRAKRILILKG